MDPGNIVRRRTGAADLGGKGHGILPTLGLGVAVSERETAGAVMVGGGPITPHALLIEDHQEVSVINALRVLIQKNEGLSPHKAPVTGGSK